MNYKRQKALLKMVFRAKGQMEKLLLNMAEEVMRHPDQFTVTEKLRLLEFISRYHKTQLDTLAGRRSASHTLVDQVTALLQKSSDIP